MKKKIAAYTLGCKVNLYDTQAMLQHFIDAGHEIVEFDSNDSIDLCIINTCCVTNAADRKSRQIVRRAFAKCRAVAVMGCAGQADADAFRKLGVDIVVGTSNRGLIFEYFNDLLCNPTTETDFGFVSKIHERTRAFLKIQDGCDNFCTYCIVPYVRGTSRSRDFSDIIAQAQHFADMQYKEIVISGIHITSYGKDLNERKKLPDVMETVCAIEDVCRVRLSSLEIGAITPHFLKILASNPKICSHLHISLQSGSDKILHAMGRPYSTEDFATVVRQLRNIRPNISVTTDIIAGFPGETENDHNDTLNFIDSICFSGIHVFPYSAKQGTVAAQMSNQLKGSTKKLRVDDISRLAVLHSEQFRNQHIEKYVNVLVEEEKSSGVFVGKTADYITIQFEAESKAPLINQVVCVKVIKLTDQGMYGTLS